MEVVIASTLLIIVTDACLIWLLNQVYSLDRELYSVKETLRKLKNENK